MKPILFALIICSIASAASAETFVSTERRLDLGALVYDVTPDGTAIVRDTALGTSAPFPASDFVVLASRVTVADLVCLIDLDRQAIERGDVREVAPGLKLRTQWLDRVAPVACHATDSRQHFTGTLHVGRTRYTTTTRREKAP